MTAAAIDYFIDKLRKLYTWSVSVGRPVAVSASSSCCCFACFCCCVWCAVANEINMQTNAKRSHSVRYIYIYEKKNTDCACKLRANELCIHTHTNYAINGIALNRQKCAKRNQSAVHSTGAITRLNLVSVIINTRESNQIELTATATTSSPVIEVTQPEPSSISSESSC